MGEIGKRNGCNYGCCSMRVGKKNFLRCKYDMISFSNQRQEYCTRKSLDSKTWEWCWCPVTRREVVVDESAIYPH